MNVGACVPKKSLAVKAVKKKREFINNLCLAVEFRMMDVNLAIQVLDSRGAVNIF